MLFLPQSTPVSITEQTSEPHSNSLEQDESRQSYTSDAERMQEIVHEARLSAWRRANTQARLHNPQ